MNEQKKDIILKDKQDTSEKNQINQSTKPSKSCKQSTDYKKLKKVIFMYNSIVIKTMEESYNTKITDFPLFQREGYLFDGWYIDEETKQRVTALIVKNDTILYARMARIVCEWNDNRIIFGSYPQSLVNDEETIAYLDKLSKTNKRGYYEYDGKEYAKVKSHLNKYEKKAYVINEKKIENDKEYYFLVEPIRWKVLLDDFYSFLLLSEIILDISEFHNSLEDRTIMVNGQKKVIQANEYEYSKIREWLNNDFYNKAFNDEERRIITETIIETEISRIYYEELVYKKTTDKIFLLSNNDIMECKYDFENTHEASATRRRKGSDYAIIKGCCIDTQNGVIQGEWWLRSPMYQDSVNAMLINAGGHHSFFQVNYPYLGVLPALRIIKRYIKDK